MKCPACVKEGHRSEVDVMSAVSTLALPRRYFDEEGREHFHDPNRHETRYRCSRGHAWTEARRHRCWCEEETP